MPQLIAQSMAVLVVCYDEVTIRGVAMIGQLFKFIWDSTVKRWPCSSAAAELSLGCDGLTEQRNYYQETVFEFINSLAVLTYSEGECRGRCDRTDGFYFQQ